jgi:hypothetical protein
VNPDRRAEPGERHVVNTMIVQAFSPCLKPDPRTDGPDIKCIRFQRASQRIFVIVAIMGDDGNGAPSIKANL